MLITPMTPNVMASPMAASASTEPSESPYQAFCRALQSASPLCIEAAASVAAFFTAGELLAGTSASNATASWSPRLPITPMASILSVSDASSRLSTTAARASINACLTRGSVSLTRACSSAGNAVASRDWNTAWAASSRLSGVARHQVQGAERRFDHAPQPIVDLDRCEIGGRTGSHRLAGGGVDQLVGAVVEEHLHGGGAEHEPPVLQGSEHRGGECASAGRDPVDAHGGVVEVTGEEAGNRVFVGAGMRRGRERGQDA